MSIVMPQIMSKMSLCLQFVQPVKKVNIKATHYCPFHEKNLPITSGFPSQMDNNVESISMSKYLHGRTLLFWDLARGLFYEWFFHHNLNSMEISFWSYPSFSKVIAMKFCIGHDRWIDMTCAKLCSDVMPCNGVIPKPIFHRIWLTMKKVREMGPISWVYVNCDMNQYPGVVDQKIIIKLLIKKFAMLCSFHWVP